MKHTTLIASVLFSTALAVGVRSAHAEPAPGFKQCNTDIDLSQVDWKPVEGKPGMWKAVLNGDPAKGAYAELDKWAAGVAPGPHTHSQDARVLALHGTMVTEVDRVVFTLSRGSSVFIPGGATHASSCSKDGDCVYCVEQPGAYDMLPAKALKMK